MKLACTGEKRARPTLMSLQPAASSRRPAESPGGLVKTLPNVRTPWGWVARRWPRYSARRARMAVSSPGRSPKQTMATTSPGPTAERRYPKARSSARRRRRPAGPHTTAQRRTPASSPAWAPAFIVTAPPAVPGMLAPHSSPSRPWFAARCTARGRDDPPPHQMSVPRTEMPASGPARRITSPRKPRSETRRFDPFPTTATGTPAPWAHRSASCT